MKIYEGMYTKAALDGGEWTGFTFLSPRPPPFRPYPTENPSASADKKLDEHLSHCEGGREENNASSCRGTENRGSNPYDSKSAKWGVTNAVRGFLSRTKFSFGKYTLIQIVICVRQQNSLLTVQLTFISTALIP